MIRFEDTSSVRLRRLAEIFTASAASLAAKYPGAAQFYRDLVQLIDSELGTRDLFGVHTAGWIDIDTPSLRSLEKSERVLICDQLQEMAESLGSHNAAVGELLEEMAAMWFPAEVTG